MIPLATISPTKLHLVDLLVVGAASTPDGPVAVGTGAPPEALDRLTAALRSVGATGRPDEVLLFPGERDQPPAMTTGLGELADPMPAETLRRAAGAATRTARRPKLALALPTADDPELIEAVALGALIGSYRFRPAPNGAQPADLNLVTSVNKSARTALRRAATIGAAVCLARRLVDTPAGALSPAKLADEAVAALEGLPVEVDVLDERALKRRKFGGILGVGQGSANPPRLVRLSYQPSGAAAHLALVGKGITFDSGGLSLKAPIGQVTMKCDMSGAAAVLAAVATAADLGLPVRITAYLACAENMPSGTAQRPGDIITAYGGKTVEVLNTDAEGRLVMMDALARCAEDAPDYVVDVATLTGAQMIALGTRIAAVMGNDDAWRARVWAAAETAGESAWQMPIAPELRASLDSTVADLANVGEKNGGMMTAAAFLAEFAPPGVPWAHMDIAGPAFNEGAPWGYTGKGATGYAVRTLVALVESLAG
ncbi:MAG: leucyl aminopeptidase [Candidatus Nanopelagicales bacterium]